MAPTSSATTRWVRRWLKAVHPVFTGLVVVALARPEWLVEIDVVAVKGGETKS